MKIRSVLVSIIFILGAIYLSLPASPYPDLQNSARSDEEGDTWQNPDQKGYYSNLSRPQVLSDIEDQFQVRVGRLVLPSYRLNYPPEEARTLVRDQLNSNYLEEIVYPLRSSIFVNGWEPKNAPGNAHLAPADIPDISLHGVVYAAKITLLPVNSPVWARLLIWTLLFPACFLVYLSFKKSLSFPT